MEHVGFDILTVHPSAKWQDPVFSLHREKVVVVYTDEYLTRDASVLLRLSLPPYSGEGAIYCPRMMSKRVLIRQLGLQLVCGVDGDNCMCFINGAGLVNEHEAAVDDAAFLSCWMIPVAREEVVETLTVADTVSLHSAGSLTDQHNGSSSSPFPIGMIGTIHYSNPEC